MEKHIKIIQNYKTNDYTIICNNYNIGTVKRHYNYNNIYWSFTGTKNEYGHVKTRKKAIEALIYFHATYGRGIAL